MYHSTLGSRVIKKKKKTRLQGRAELQGYLAHKKRPPPEDHRRALGIVGARMRWFLMSEVPLYLDRLSMTRTANRPLLERAHAFLVRS